MSKMNKQELLNYYEQEIKRFEEEGGIGAKLNIPVLKQQLNKVKE